MKRTVLLLVVVCLSGCAGSFEVPPSNADYGTPPESYEQSVKEWFITQLKDPDSAKYIFEKPQKAYTNRGLVYGGVVGWKGYVVGVQVNAKNSYGAFVGYKPYLFCFSGERIEKVIEGSDWMMLHRVK